MSISTKLWQYCIVFLTPFAANADPVVAADSGQAALGKLVLGLLCVLALIYGCAWAMKRLRLPNAFSTSVMKVDAVVAVGTREKIVLLTVGGQQLVVGVTPSSIQTLHVLSAGKTSEISMPFAQQLQQAEQGQSKEFTTKMANALEEVTE